MRCLLVLAALIVAFTPASAHCLQAHWVMFDSNSDAIDEEAASKLQRFALDVGDRRIVIRGHADRSEGSEVDTLDLSQRRARMVHEHLQAYGVSPARMTVEALGSSRPAVEGMADARLSRRVEILSAGPEQ